ncbi:MAG: A24 family peptidase [Armatimonadia bacterium]
MITLHHTTLIATCLLLVVAVFTDVRDGKIYNAVTLPFALLGMVLNLLNGGLTGLLLSIAGVAVGLALFFVSGLLGRLLGAGDCKLFAAVGALLGPQVLLWAILYSLVAGGIFGILMAIWRGVLRQALQRVWQALYFRVYMKTPMDITNSPSKLRLPYAIAICAGTLFTIWVRQ